MTCFMTYSVFSLSFSGLFPQQSEYLMLITLYFLLSIVWTLLSMAWFVVCNFYTSKGEMPKPLYVFCGWLQRLFYCCFPRPKEDNKVNASKEGLLENGQFKNPDNKLSDGSNHDQDTKNYRFRHLPPIFSSKLNEGDGIVGKENIIGEQTEPTENKPVERATDACLHGVDGKDNKTKCNFCERCKPCKADFDKDKTKSKNKKDVESKCNALNYLIFCLILLFMFISNMILWFIMAA